MGEPAALRAGDGWEAEAGAGVCSVPSPAGCTLMHTNLCRKGMARLFWVVQLAEVMLIKWVGADSMQAKFERRGKYGNNSRFYAVYFAQLLAVYASLRASVTSLR